MQTPTKKRAIHIRECKNRQTLRGRDVQFSRSEHQKSPFGTVTKFPLIQWLLLLHRLCRGFFFGFLAGKQHEIQNVNANHRIDRAGWMWLFSGMMNRADIRWKQRFENFEKAFHLLADALAGDIDDLNDLEKEGVIQRFEYTLELAWKVLKDKMSDDGLILDQFSPKAVIRKAFGTRYIDDGDIWLQMVGDRNLLSHTYNFKTFEEVLRRVKNAYIPVLSKLYDSLKVEVA